MSKCEIRDKDFTVCDSDYADVARRKMEGLNKSDKLTTTQLRKGIYANITNALSRISNDDEFAQRQSDLQYLKVKMAYAAGREPLVMEFLNVSHLMALLDDVKSYEQFKLYCLYAESLVAYFKFFGGKDN